MTTVVLQPDFLSVTELDDYLTRGWFRVGRHLMTRRYQVHDRSVRGVVWTRLPLRDFAFRKSLRKLLSRNKRRFRVTHGPMVLDEQRQQVYERYWADRPWGNPGRELTEFLGGQEGIPIFQTREVALWDGDRLAAFGLFDQGERSLQSLVGAYDPEYREFSPGFTTLLLEIEVGLEHGLDYHYTGDIVFEPTMREHYKFRPGPLEFLHPSEGTWQRDDHLVPSLDPALELQHKLNEVRIALQLIQVETRIEVHQWFELGLYNPRLDKNLDQPMALICGPAADDSVFDVVTWDGASRRYGLQRCVRAISEGRRIDSDEVTRIPLIWVRQRRGTYDTVGEVVAALTKR